MIKVMLFLFVFTLQMLEACNPLTIKTSPKGEYAIPVTSVCSPSTPSTPCTTPTGLEKEAVICWQDAHTAYQKADYYLNTVKMHIPGDWERAIEIIEQAVKIAVCA